MADLRLRREGNAPGAFFVDSTCIDCGTCRWMAPAVYARDGEGSVVVRQPEGDAGRAAALRALVACPTASIGADVPGAEARAARDAFPHPVTEDVFHCGYHAEGSFGAAAYFIRRPEGNILVDSPRFAGPLVKRLEALGGVAWMVLTHRDDVADHARFAQRFGCRRVLHADDVTGATRDVEVRPEGTEPFEVVPGLVGIPVPGHTAGHVVYLWHDEVLFTGDHLAWHPERGRLTAFRGACWFDWGEQTRSMERLLEYRFSRVLPGHGHPVHLEKEAMRRSLEACVRWMRTV